MRSSILLRLRLSLSLRQSLLCSTFMACGKRCKVEVTCIEARSRPVPTATRP